jgi:hypothetical protein
MKENRETAEDVMKKPYLLTISNTNPINEIACGTYYIHGIVLVFV